MCNQLLAIMLLLQEIARPACSKPEPRFGDGRPADVHATAPPSTTAAYLSPEVGPRYRCEKHDWDAWAVLDSRKGDALLVLTKCKKGA